MSWSTNLTDSHGDAGFYLDEHEGIARRFIEGYLTEPGFILALTEAVALAMPAQDAGAMVKLALRSLPRDHNDTFVYVRQQIISEALTLDFLVRHARSLREAVIPASWVPNEELMNAYLALFRERR